MKYLPKPVITNLTLKIDNIVKNTYHPSKDRTFCHKQDLRTLYEFLAFLASWRFDQLSFLATFA